MSMKKTKKRYLIIEDSSESYDNYVTVCWNKLPSGLISKLDGRCLHNVPSVNEDGDLEEKTIVFLKPVKRLSKSLDIYELDNIIIGNPV